LKHFGCPLEAGHFLRAMSRKKLRTFPLGLARFSEDFAAPPNEQMAIAVLATIPVVIVFWSLQRTLRTGFTLTGLKG